MGVFQQRKYHTVGLLFSIICCLIVLCSLYDLKFMQPITSRLQYKFTTNRVLNARNFTSFLNPRSTPSQRRKGATNTWCRVFTEVENTSFMKGTLSYSRGKAIMFVHSRKDLISSNILTNHYWEKPSVEAMEVIFNVDPNINLIDVGCNLGAYTITAAMRRRKVVAIDANIMNVQRLRKSLVANKVEKNVQIVYNAISDRHATFSIKTPTYENIGDTFLVSTRSGDSIPVRSIKMDDLLEVINFNRAIMKIDIQGHEYEAFHHADKLFSEVDIPIVLLEWVLFKEMKDTSHAKFIMAFFRRHRYKPYPNLLSDEPLNDSDFKIWPYDVIWKREF